MWGLGPWGGGHGRPAPPSTDQKLLDPKEEVMEPPVCSWLSGSQGQPAVAMGDGTWDNLVGLRAYPIGLDAVSE